MSACDFSGISIVTSRLVPAPVMGGTARCESATAPQSPSAWCAAAVASSDRTSPTMAIDSAAGAKRAR
jgi:hypothetical protein